MADDRQADWTRRLRAAAACPKRPAAEPAWDCRSASYTTRLRTTTCQSSSVLRGFTCAAQSKSSLGGPPGPAPIANVPFSITNAEFIPRTMFPESVIPPLMTSRS